MPGVPSGRGCDACRKQKKKCDQSKPSCGRCARLQIECKGSGERRYKFVQENALVVSPGANSSNSSRSSSRSRLQPTQTVSRRISRSPASNEMNGLIASFVSLLEVPDLRYSVGCYGAFLKHIPQRLGKNEALDASVRAITCAFPSVYTREESPDALLKYGQALRTLRTCLSDPAKSQQADTLCAIYLIIICQGWLGKQDDQPTNHGEGLAIILKTATYFGWNGHFEAEMLVTLSLPVIVESVINPKIQLEPWISILIERYISPRVAGCDKANANDVDGPIFSLSLHNLARFPGFVRNPEEHHLEIKSMYQQLCLDLPKVAHHLARSTDGTGPQTRLQAMYSLLLCIALILNGILRAFDPFDAFMLEEAARFSDETISLSERARQYRPLGSSHMGMCLMAAWAATDNDTFRRANVERMLLDYQADFAVARWLDGGLWLKKKYFELRQKLGNTEVEDFYGEAPLVRRKDDPQTTTELCCMQ